MGACFSTIFEVALGDVTHDEAGSASGSLSAVQQLATAVGLPWSRPSSSTLLRESGGTRAMTTSVLVAAGVIVVCVGLVGFMPRAAPPPS